MPDPAAPSAATFAYEAQSADGRTFRGTLDAPALAAAAEQLRSLDLRVTRLVPAERPRAPLRDGDLLLFNQQLSHLTAGGLPLDRGLRLIADELPRRQARAVRAIAADLEGGAPIGDAFAGRSGVFPPLYAQLLEAGVRANNLPGVLVNLGHHVELMQRLRAAVWRAASYPLMVAVALLIVMGFVWGYVIPQMGPLTGAPGMPEPIFRSYKSPPPQPDPSLTLLPAVGRALSFGVMAVLAIVLLAVFATWVAGRSARGRRAAAPLLRPLPVVGPVVRWNEVARWCDALHLGLSAGLDLPAALSLAGAATDSEAGRADTELLLAAVRAGQPMEPAEPLRLLPATVPAALQMGVDQNDLPAAAATLARMYREQAEVRLAVVPQVLSPALLLLTAACVAMALGAALLPLVSALRMLTRSD
jgi:type IV pilus assembly protein PilC